MNNADLLDKFYTEKPWLDVAANDHFIVDNAGIPPSIQGMRNAASRLGSRLAIDPEYENGWQEYVRKHPEHNHPANRQLGFEKLNPHQPPTVEAFEEIAKRSEKPFLVTKEFSEAQARQAEREHLIKEITLGKDQYGAFDGRYGCIKYYPSSHLAEETDERIREIHGIVTEQRRLAGLSPSEKRKEPIPQAAEFKLINPDTGVEFTRKELINASKATLKWLVFGDSATAKPHVSARITAILKGNI
jgi:hypothetical protein